MSRIGERFDQLLKSGSKALMPFVTAGDPDLETTRQLVAAMEQNGADLIELGIPFSDPLADGATIQQASHRALQRGIDLEAILKMVQQMRAQSSIPLVLMSYYNPIHRYGLEPFVEHAMGAGVDGVILPDLPPDEAEAERFLHIAKPRDLDLIFLVTPGSTDERIDLVNEHASGFIYCVSLTGVTGARQRMNAGLRAFVERVRGQTAKPLAVGFGISTPAQAREITQYADGIIVGSAIVDIVQRAKDRQAAVNEVGAFVSALKGAIQEGD
jgi:tryptophan synthase alpha chain